jgi:hypothetical protein
MNKHEYKIFFIKENNKIKHMAVYDNFCEFLLTEDYSTMDIIVNSYTISKTVYDKILEMRKYTDFENMSLTDFNDILKHDEIMI